MPARLSGVWSVRGETTRNALSRLSAAGPIQITAREREILEPVAGGETDQDIAEQLTISVRTVHSHLDRIRDKTGSRRRADLTRFAIERGIIPRSPKQG